MQTKKTRKLWAFFLCFAMLLTLFPAAKSKAAEMPEAVINGEEHSDLSLAEIFENYEHTDPAEFYAGVEELRALAEDEENAGAAYELYEKLDTAYTKAYTMWITSSVALNVNMADTKMLEEEAYNTTNINQMRDKLCLCMQEILDLPGTCDILAELTEDDIEFFRDYEEMTPEQLDAINREQALLQKYRAKQFEMNAMTVTVNDTEMGFADIEAAAMAGLLDADTYYSKHMELMDKQNALLGEAYIELVNIRREIAKLYDYANYNDYMYETYGRDYTPEEIETFCDSVKTYLATPSAYMQALMDFAAPSLAITYTEEEIFSILSTYIPQTSADLQDAFDHLVNNKLYDIGYSETKMEGAFTSYYPYYNTESIVMQPSGITYDLLTMVHEFGHFNSDYQHGSTESLDVAEVQSQALEFLFMEHYEDIFGDDADTVEEYVTLQLLSSFITGCMTSELENWAYLQENLTLDALNAKYKELMVDYEQMQPDTWSLEYYSKSWMQIPHIFTNPCYYISYATSVAGAFAIRELMMENPTAAVSAYLDVADAEPEKGFSEVMEDAGLGDVLAPEAIEAVGKELMEHFDLEKRIEEMLAQSQPPQQPEEPEPETPEEPQPEEPQPDDVREDSSKTAKTCYVRKGDTLAKIGKRYQVDWKEIAKLNGIKAPYKIYAGQQLTLPDNAVIATEKVTVQKGDTLGKIAASLGMNWQVLAEKLGIGAPYTIYEGQVLEFSY